VNGDRGALEIALEAVERAGRPGGCEPWTCRVGSWSLAVVSCAAGPVPAGTVLDEEERISTAFSGSRRAEFLAGRAALRLACRGVGVADIAVPIGALGQAVPPRGVAACLTHKRGVALAVAALHSMPGDSIGVDLEFVSSRNTRLLERVLGPAERDGFSGADLDPVAAVHVCIAAKEAAIKAASVRVSERLRFADISIATISGETLRIQVRGGLALTGVFARKPPWVAALAW